MKELLSKIPLLISKVFKKVSLLIYNPNQITNQYIYDWVKDAGDKKLRYDYELTSNSIVFDFGGFKGEWASKIYCMYSPTIYIFEPMEEYYNEMKTLFKKNDKVNIFKYGLSNKTEKQEFYINEKLDGFSLVNRTDTTLKEKVNINLVSVKDFFQNNKIKNIDLMKINIEGGGIRLA